MNVKAMPVIHVYYMSGSTKLAMGRLALKNRSIFFEYNTDFLKSGLELSPFKLPLKPGVLTSEHHPFDGLFGVFNDSLPDGWGRLLLDRKLMKQGINPHELSPLDRLRYVGSVSMGALLYEPEVEAFTPSHQKDLDEIADETRQFQETGDERFVDELFAMNASSAGARPKIMLRRDAEDWIVKFRSSVDPKDIGSIEYAYHLMAKDAHLDVPEASLFPSKMCSGHFGVKRFDRVENKRFHTHTISGLLHADHRIPSLDYETILKATLWLTKDVMECEKQFRAAIFNVFAHNRDDHAKNFSFIMENNGTWHVSPAYDLTFSAGPAGEHCSTLMGEGKNPGVTHLLKLADRVGIKQQTAARMIEEVRSAVSNWESFAKDAEVTPPSLRMVQTALDRINKNNE
jgi:serine/threonine-protein kinase HipA